LAGGRQHRRGWARPGRLWFGACRFAMAGFGLGWGRLGRLARGKDSLGGRGRVGGFVMAGSGRGWDTLD
jgi:hypothetical protein